MPTESVRLSIVVAAWNGETPLRQCLRSLSNQVDRDRDEIVVVGNFPLTRFEGLQQPGFRTDFITMPPGTTVPVLRSRGIERSRGTIVALLEDHCTVDNEWCAQILEGHRSAYAIVGGSVENASDAALSWAVYFYDYGKYMLPAAPQVAAALSGNNVSYKRFVLEQVRESFRGGFYEAVIHEELRRRGYRFYFVPAAIVYHEKDYVVRNAVCDCYHHGRLYAAQRVARAGSSARLIRTLGAFLLPMVLPARIVGRTVLKRRLLRELATCFPYVMLLMTAWSCGEAFGYARGPGTSAARWR